MATLRPDAPELEDRVARCEKALDLLANLYSDRDDNPLDGDLEHRLRIVTTTMQVTLDRTSLLRDLIERSVAREATDEPKGWIPDTSDVEGVLTKSHRAGILATQLPAARAIGRAMNAANDFFGEIDGVYPSDNNEATKVSMLLSKALGIVMRASEEALEYLDHRTTDRGAS